MTSFILVDHDEIKLEINNKKLHQCIEIEEYTLE